MAEPLARRPVPELAPSQTAEDSPSLPRTVGPLGVAVGIAGIGLVFVNSFVGPRLIGIPMAVGMILLGFALGLYHALREKDLVILRTYGFLGLALALLSGILTIVNSRNFPLYSWAGLTTALFFLICHARREEDPSFLKFIRGFLFTVGIGCTLTALFRGAGNPDFLLEYGVLLLLVGLLYLAGYLSQVGVAEEWGFRISQIIGVLGVGVFVAAAVRTLLPNVGFDDMKSYIAPRGTIFMLFGALLAGLGLGSSSDSKLLVMTRRELNAFFYSPIAYLCLVGMSVVGFINLILFVSGWERPRFEPIIGGFLMNLVPAFVLVFLIPAITMRLVSEEKRTGTFDVLFTAPVKELTVVLSKFSATLIVFLMLWLPVFLYLLPLRLELGQAFDYKPVISFFVALMFIGSAFISMGLFFSSVTKNQVIAAVLTFTGILFFLLLVMFTGTPILSESLRKVLSRLAFWSTLSEAIQGRLFLRDLVIYASMTMFWLFLSVKVLETRKWN